MTTDVIDAQKGRSKQKAPVQRVKVLDEASSRRAFQAADFGGYWPSTGFMTIIYLLYAQPATRPLLLHGFDFFKAKQGKTHSSDEGMV